MKNSQRILIQGQIASGNIQDALNEIEALCESPYYRRVFLVLTNRLDQLSKETIANTITPEERERRQNKLNLDLLELMDQLFEGKTPLKESFKHEDQPSPNIQQNAKNIINIKNIEGDNIINI